MTIYADLIINLMAHSRSKEDFLKTVYILQQADERVSTNKLCSALSISAPSVTDMAQRLVEDGLIDYQKYKGVRLTAAGEAIALKMLRRHRLLELYLVQELGYPLPEVHDEAEKLEHAVSDRFIEAVAQKLGHPSFDPHGDPIPSREGVMLAPDLMPLTELPLAISASVSRFTASDDALLAFILEKGFQLRRVLCVLSREPFEGPLTVQFDDQEIVTVGHQVANAIQVERNG